MSESILKKQGSGGLFYLPAIRQASIATDAAKLRYTSLAANIVDCSSLVDVLTELGTALAFPIWYGANFDALQDCLTDPDWHPAKGHVILISGIARLRAADPTAFVTLIDVLKASVEARQSQQHPFWILIDAPARGIPAFPEA